MDGTTFLPRPIFSFFPLSILDALCFFAFFVFVNNFLFLNSFFSIEQSNFFSISFLPLS
jgi:hypothetical protein